MLREKPLSLLNFISVQQPYWNEAKTILELGCDQISIFENEFSNLDIRVTAIDKRADSIEIAQEFSTDQRINYVVHDVLDRFAGFFDVVIDAHLLHMLTDSKQRARCLENICDHLLPGGYLLGETMAYNKGLEFYLPYYFDMQDEVLYKMVDNCWVAQRAIFDVYRIEQELLKYFDIRYFFVDSCLDFQFSTIKKSHVSSLKFICQKR